MRWATRIAATEAVSNPLLRSAYSLMLNVLLTASLGMVFWVVAARTFPSDVVGRDSALISSMIVVATICQLNLSSGVVRFLPITRLRPARVVLAAYATAGTVALAGGLAFVLAAPRLAQSYRFLGESKWLAVLYVAAVTLTGVFGLQDSVLIALRRAPWVPVENGSYGLLKVALIPAMLAAGVSEGVFLAWVFPIAMLVLAVNLLLFTRALPVHTRADGELSPVERFGWGGVARFMAQDYLATILVEGTTAFLPVLVVALAGSVDGAHFYMPFMIVSAFDLLFVNVAQSLTVEGAMAHREIPRLVRTTVRRFRYVLLGGIVVLVAGAWPLLLPFGARYADAGVPVMRLLACASAFRALVNLYSALCRLEGKADRVLGTHAAVFVMTLGLALLLGRDGGIEQVALAWLIANAVTAFATSPHLLRVYRAGRPSSAQPL